MPKFYGFGKCTTCGIPCTSGNFLDFERKRYCTSCWIENANPDHPELKEIREKVEAAVKEWKCAKWTREEGPLPMGPKPVKK
jgi:hypothetical protein|tara:strand:- start:1830 stop:2075 length:246 start_codon:yes stop_codon:yes gene_type:complete